MEGQIEAGLFGVQNPALGRGNDPCDRLPPHPAAPAHVPGRGARFRRAVPRSAAPRAELVRAAGVRHMPRHRRSFLDYLMRGGAEARRLHAGVSRVEVREISKRSPPIAGTTACDVQKSLLVRRGAWR